MALLNGVPVDVAKLKTLALANYGHFSTMLVADLQVRGLALHLARLARDCRLLFDAELDPDRVRRLLRQALAEFTEPVVARVTVFDPGLDIGHPGADAQPYVLITTRPAPTVAGSPVRLRTARYLRDMPEVKHVGLFSLMRHRRIAQRSGFDDVLLVDERSRIAEAATSNIGFFDGKRLVWPQAPCLPGVTMDLLCQAHDGPLDCRPLSVAEAAHLPLAFITNAVVGICEIRAIDDVLWPAAHSVLDVLRAEYAAIPTESL